MPGHPYRYDVIVVGAGPVGLTAAIELIRYGAHVCVLDANLQKSSHSKAFIVWSRTLEHLDRQQVTVKKEFNGLPLPLRRILTCTQRYSDWLYDSLARQMARGRRKTSRRSIYIDAELSAVICSKSVSSTFPYGVIIPQGETEQLLEERLNSYGGMVYREHEVTHVTQDCQSVTVRASALLIENTFHAAWLIAADGAHSLIRHRVKYAFAGHTHTDTWLVVDAKIKTDRYPDDVEAHFSERGTLVIIPLGRRPWYRLAMPSRLVKTELGERPPPPPALPIVQMRVDELSTGKIHLIEAAWMTYYRVNERLVENYRCGRIFFAGDSAHVHSPAGAHGMNTGMQDAIDISWKLGCYINGQLPEPAAERLLNTYDGERRSIARQVIRLTGDMARTARKTSNLERLYLRTMLKIITKIGRLYRYKVNEGMELHWKLRRTSICQWLLSFVYDHWLQAGDRLPTWPGEPPVSHGSRPLFTIYTEPSSLVAACTVRDAYPNLVDSHIRATPAEIHPKFLLVRPDGFIAVAASACRWKKALAYLSSLQRVP